jgi:2-polyprenyl-3-methyl-5-hydroxy-6-metoxy-1,4-benzoquinol methylase
MINIWKYKTIHKIWKSVKRHPKAARLLCNITTWYYRNARISDLVDIYDAAYHDNYGASNASEVKIKKAQALALRQTFAVNKILIGGCADGLLVQELRNLGFDAYGFDLSQAALANAGKDIRPFLREGSLTNIPFDAADEFEMFVAIDVIEHIPEKQIDAVVAEWQRLRIECLALVINCCDLQCAGHVTMKPLSWWQKRLKDAYSMEENIQMNMTGIPKVYSLDENAEDKFTFWRKITSIAAAPL